MALGSTFGRRGVSTMITRLAPESPADFQHMPGVPEVMALAKKADVRRRWVIRTSLTLALSSVLLTLVVVVQRDRSTVAEFTRSLDRSASALQTIVNSLGRLPLAAPESLSKAGLSYASAVQIEFARRTDQPVIVAATAKRSLLLGEDGHGVLIYEKGKVRAAWLPRPRFVAEYVAQQERVNKFEEARESIAPNLPQ